MANFHLGFEVEGEKQISAELGIAIDGLTDFSDPMAEAADIMMTAVEDNFDKRGGRFGGWKPRSPLSKGSHPLLEDSGDMRGAFYKESNEDSARVGNDDKKFPYHQSNEPRTRLPRRVMLMIDDTMRTEIFKVFQLYIVTKLRGGK